MIDKKKEYGDLIRKKDYNKLKQQLLSDKKAGIDINSIFGGKLGEALDEMGFSQEDINRIISDDNSKINEYVELYNDSDVIYLSGGPGVGKSTLAKAIHDKVYPDKDPDHPFIYKDAGTLQHADVTMARSELFGSEKGSFTGATESKNGAFIDAKHGTLFIDEIQKLPIEVQRLLNGVLDRHEVARVGGGAVPYHCKVIVASNVDIDKLVKDGKFAIDLAGRLSQNHINVPALNSDPNMLYDFVNSEIDALNDKFGTNITISGGAINILQNIPYESDKRELKGILLNAYKTAQRAGAESIQPQHLSGAKEKVQIKASDISKALPGYDQETYRDLANQPKFTPETWPLNKVQLFRICKVFKELGGDYNKISTWLQKGNFGFVVSKLDNPKGLDRESIMNVFREILDVYSAPNTSDSDVLAGMTDIMTLKESIEDDFRYFIPEAPEEKILDTRVLESMETTLITDEDIIGISKGL